MPRVSEAHLAARREQIVEAATRCFVRNGFHQTSMQDVIKEAGLSVGAFYRYFTSKSELIKAIASEKVGNVVSTVEGLLRQEPMPPLLDVLDEVLGHVDQELGADGAVRIAVQVWGEAVHDPEIAAMVSGIYGQIRDATGALAERAQRDGQLPAGTDPAATGAAIFGFVQGYILQNVTVGRIDRTTYLDGLRNLLGAAPA
ncbi:TetR/AcrR family transcriptional regulator [Dactylosporangium sucinum]|uniref:TetR/AcrR family transcriptional regulator n=1 Tax=Dactylosporangium sucinum TaxID=1424081 RepID=UPI00167E0D76|nr:TetR/AcrR family transcriptional regulator [Dactylosporangium sucinum]